MKKGIKIFLAVIAFIVIIALICLITPVSDAVGKMVGWTGDKIKSVAATVASLGVGILLVTVGVTALAAAPIVGVALIVIGLVSIGYALWPLFTSSSTGGQLNKIAP